ncbi:polypeptide deformylase [endosymbiont of Acanthamoeba sp. UWC8]|uniref:peptide deformylase n=1 Tax=endosymbiont of Acanthamoeba sp. UWC8 TaxID=86106 RepID=UPI0004D180B5|nr:peptide deformylase [endosymbiont of Acanthamoeba sp. UWC8]AIF80782.1 polypeptide deformylase [endosymbiont of Acanthamoeba sp. UWC8]
MALMQVIKEPDPLLRKVSKPVQKFDAELTNFIDDLIETMYEEKGMGIAAIQVGKPIRALVVDIPIKEEKNPLVIINPKIKFLSKETVILDEGCLSVKSDNGTLVNGKVERPISITIEYRDLQGNFKKLVIDGTKSEYDLWFARCLQHELDHLDGILFIDKLCTMQDIAAVSKKECIKS